MIDPITVNLNLINTSLYRHLSLTKIETIEMLTIRLDTYSVSMQS